MGKNSEKELKVSPTFVGTIIFSTFFKANRMKNWVPSSTGNGSATNFSIQKHFFAVKLKGFCMEQLSLACHRSLTRFSLFGIIGLRILKHVV